MPHDLQNERTPRNRRRTRLACAAALVAASAALAWSTSGASAPQPPSTTRDRANAKADAARPEAARADLGGAARPLARAHPPAQEALGQGLRGRVVEATGAPVAGVTVQLNESPNHDPASYVLPARRRHLHTPVATATSNADGEFALGVATSDKQTYDVFLRSTNHATLRLAGIELQADAWYDVGTLTLEPGATLQGRVTVAGTPSLPAPNAVVTVSSGSPFYDGGGERSPNALTADAAADGRYLLEHAPTRGVVQVSAAAPGFARAVRRDVALSPGAPVTVDFALQAGATLTGSVRTLDGAPVAAATVSAWPQRPGAREVRGFSDRQGAFSLPGLPPGKLRVVASARGHANVEVRDVEAGAPLPLFLRPSNRIQVTAKTPAGAVLRRYRLAVRRFFPAKPDRPLDAATLAGGQIGGLPEVPVQRVRLDGATDQAEVDGLPPGTFVCEVLADGWAKTLSLPVRFAAGDRANLSLQRIEIVVTHGASLSGRIVDAAGRPLEGASVTTETPIAARGPSMFRSLQRAAPPKITRQTARTGADGRFSLDQLALATYALRVEHPAACGRVVLGIECKMPIGQHLSDIQLQRGAIVRGTAVVAGRAAVQIQVVLSTTPDTPPERSIRLETVTDGEGRYAFDRRIPVGRYVLRAASVGSSQPDAEIFRQMLQFQKSTTTLHVNEGQRVVERHLTLPAK